MMLFTLGGDLLLNEFPNATLAYSLQKINKAYTGYCIKVRRSSDNTTLDVGFSGNALDTTTLMTFVGAGDGFVEIWYDQSGNARNAIQNTTALQPIIVEAGVLIVINGNPTLDFSTRFLAFSSVTLNSSWSVFSVGEGVEDQRFVPIAGAEAVPVATLMRFTDNKYYVISGAVYTISDLIDTSQDQMLLSAVVIGTTISMRKNSTLLSDTDVPSSNNNTISQVGKYGSTELGNALFQEIIFYNSDQSASVSGIEQNIKNRYTSIP